MQSPDGQGAIVLLGAKMRTILQVKRTRGNMILNKENKVSKSNSPYDLKCHGGAIAVFHKLCRITRS